MKIWSINKISESRALLMGIATLLVCFFHSIINFDLLVQHGGALKIIGVCLYQIQDICNIGVDIFLFVSGFGLYYSMSKHHNVISFYKGRIIKIVIPALIISAILSYITTDNILAFLMRFSMLSFLTNGDRYFWYLWLIFVLYLVYPFIYKLLNKNSGLINCLLVVIILVFNFILFFTAKTLYQNIEIALTRIPVFIIGSILGKLSKEGKQISYNIIKLIYIATPLFILLLIISNYFLCRNENFYIERYLSGITTICIVFVSSDLNSKINAKHTKAFFAFIGKYSLELYLFYTELLFRFKKPLWFLNFSSVVFCLAVLLIILLIGIIYKYLYNKSVSGIKKRVH